VSVVTRVRRATTSTDRYGDTATATTASTVIAGAFVAPGPSTELTEAGRDGVTVDATIYCPAGTDLTHLDDVDIDGVRFRVVGHPAEWVHPWSGWEPGVVAELARVQG
jgi:hypothetical protein